MSSIAYVTDQNMLEYHRLCRNREMLFWRLSTREIADFHKGDLLFFFARGTMGRKKGLVGYAHYDSAPKLSMKQMWKKYGTLTGYDTYEYMEEAITKAARGGTVPKVLHCLYLTDVVFFLSPIYAKEAGLSIPANLESYQYLDQEDPEATVRILKKAEEHGIDLWYSDSGNAIFQLDEIRHLASMVHFRLPQNGSKTEQKKAAALAAEKTKEKNWELIKGSNTDCIRIDAKSITVGLPLVYNTQDKNLRIQEWMGRMTMYRILLKQNGLEKKIHFEILSAQDTKEVEEMMNGVEADA